MSLLQEHSYMKWLFGFFSVETLAAKSITTVSAHAKGLLISRTIALASLQDVNTVKKANNVLVLLGESF